MGKTNQKIMCPKCHKNPAPITEYGVVWCKSCNDAKKPISKGYPEFVPDYIKEERYKNKNDIVQPFRQGEFSQEFKESQPDVAKKMVQEGSITQHQYDHARPVWKGDVEGW